MKTDRELIELAAKACGYTLLEYGKKPRLALNHDDPVYKKWNPLLDDGDSFRLMVKMQIKVKWHAVLNQAFAWDGVTETTVNGEDHGGAEAATRRAIVLMAAQQVEEL